MIINQTLIWGHNTLLLPIWWPSGHIYVNFNRLMNKLHVACLFIELGSWELRFLVLWFSGLAFQFHLVCPSGFCYAHTYIVATCNCVEFMAGGHFAVIKFIYWKRHTVPDRKGFTFRSSICKLIDKNTLANTTRSLGVLFMGSWAKALAMAMAMRRSWSIWHN